MVVGDVLFVVEVLMVWFLVASGSDRGLLSAAVTLLCCHRYALLICHHGACFTFEVQLVAYRKCLVYDCGLASLLVVETMSLQQCFCCV